MIYENVILEFWYIRSSRPEVSVKKEVLRNFTQFTGKRLFFNKVAGLSLHKKSRNP